MKRFIVLCLSLFLLAGGGFLLATQSEPSAGLNHFQPSAADYQRISSLWQRLNPAVMKSGQSYSVDLSERDLNMLLSMAAAGDAKLAAMNPSVSLADVPVLHFSLPLAGRFVEGDAALSLKQGSLPEVSRVWVSGLQLPAAVADQVQQALLQNIKPSFQTAWLQSRAGAVMTPDGQLRFSFIWRPELLR